MNKIECFKVRLFETELENKFDMKLYHEIKTIKCDNFGLIPRYTKSIMADPFLFVKGNVLYLFYESKKLFKNATIEMISTNDLKRWSAPVTVLSESIHLSYPFVFEHENNVYMIPETSALKTINLYKAQNKDLTNFEFHKTILTDNNDYTDGEFSFSYSSILENNGRFYLQTSVLKNGKNILKMYHSDFFDGPYYEAKYSPLLTDNRCGRNAGCNLVIDGTKYRFAQDCEVRYGDNVNVYRIETLSSDEYKENLVIKGLYSAGIRFYKEGGHHFNCVDFLGKRIIATDAKEYHYYIVPRIINKIVKKEI